MRYFIAGSLLSVPVSLAIGLSLKATLASTCVVCAIALIWGGRNARP